MNVDLNTLSDDDLKKLTIDEIKELLYHEFFEMRLVNEDEHNWEEILKDQQNAPYLQRILELFLTMDVTSFGNIEDYHLSKSSLLIKEHLQQEMDISDSRFFLLIQALYSERYLTYFKAEEFTDNPLKPFEEYWVNANFLKQADKTARWRYNLLWIYQNHSDLFNLAVPDKENSYYPANDVYKDILTSGSIVQVIIESNLRLTDKGMHFLQMLFNQTIRNSIEVSRKFNEQFEKKIQQQETGIKQQEEGIKRQAEGIKKQNSVTQSLQRQVKKQKKQVDSFYQHIVSILALLVAAFCFIGINISAIPRIEENFAENVIILNLSLILVTTVIFWIIKALIFETEENDKKQKFWYIITAVTVTLLIAVYGWLGPNAEKHNLNKYKKQVEKQYDSKFDNLKNELEKANLRIENLNEKIDQLETQDKSTQ